jgi:hypothetical protein
VLSGGVGAAGVLGDTLEWDGAAWIVQAPSPSLPARFAHGMAYDAARRQVVSFGGADATMRLGETRVYEPTVRGAVTTVGSGCAGTSGVPTLAASGAPIVGNGDFVLRVDSARPSSTVLAALSPFGANQAMPGGCTLLVAAPWLEVLGTGDPSGQARLPAPIPLTASLSGAVVYAQAFVADPNGAFFGSVAFANGLALVVGD